MGAAEYDGDQHRTNRNAYVKDMQASAKLQRLGWICVIKKDRDEDIIDRAYRTLVSRGWDGQLHPP